MAERALTFQCEGEHLVGIVHEPDTPASTGVLVVVGGPQYRAGSHRQFVLLARDLAKQGFAVFRFDCRGMGDGSGEFPGFEHISPDIQAAVNTFQAQVPAVQQVVIWGLCDAASAAMIYAHSDARVSGLVLLNPWVRSASGQAQTLLKHYYLKRFFSAAFWRDVLTGKFRALASVRSFLSNLLAATSKSSGGEQAAAGKTDSRPFQQRMRDGINRFDGRVLLVLSGNDLTAAEFRDLIASEGNWRPGLEREGVEQHEFADANHTFSCADARNQVAKVTARWLTR